VSGPKRIRRSKRLSWDWRLLTRFDEADDYLNPSPLQLLKGLFNDEAFCGAAWEFRIGKPQEPSSWLRFDGLGFQQIWNRQKLE
jgi:hypothetical protein